MAPLRCQGSGFRDYRQDWRGRAPDSLRSVRAYGYDLLHFARWCGGHSLPNLIEMDESTLLTYVRDQLSEEPKPTPQTINHRSFVDAFPILWPRIPRAAYGMRRFCLSAHHRRSPWHVLWHRYPLAAASPTTSVWAWSPSSFRERRWMLFWSRPGAPVCASAIYPLTWWSIT
jgi:hypothetical protein